MANRKCIQCGSPTYYTKVDGTPSETCQNCSFVIDCLNAFVEATNRHIPLTGKPRKLTITGFKIERV